MTDDFILDARGMTKSFNGVVVLNNVSLQLKRGEVHALLGENGAGKSTFIKVLGGIYKPDSGAITLDGQRVEITNPLTAIHAGIAIVHQELNLIPEMTPVENIFLGREIVDRLGRINRKEMVDSSKRLLQSFNLDIDLNKPVRLLSVAQQQMVEIVKAISLNAQILILDEPTDVLTDRETQQLFTLVRDLKSKGTTIIYITHRLDEIFQVCDRYTVLRDGNLIYTDTLAGTTKDAIVRMMVARELSEQYPYVPAETGHPVLEVKNLGNGKNFSNISFEVNGGEIATFYGLVGAGRTELMLGILGALPGVHGSVSITGEEKKIKSPSDANRNGIVYITESRKELGILPEMSVQFNTSISNIRAYTNRLNMINESREKNSVSEMVKLLAIKINTLNQGIKQLSGGNQQKVLLARSLLVTPKILICDEPTRGIDVGARVSIYNILNQLKKSGMAILIVSSDLPEVLGISDRVYTMYHGEINGMFERKDFDEYRIGNAAFGKESLDRVAVC